MPLQPLLLALSALASSAATARLLPAAPSRATSGLGVVSDTSTLTIIYASDGSRKDYVHSDALFGIPAYGGGVQARIYHPSPNPSFGCTPITDPQTPPGSVLLLNRGGGCTFTQKAWAAQSAGAAGLILIDNLGVCGVSPACSNAVCGMLPGGAMRCPYYQPLDITCECDLPLLADDGSGALITIPTFLVGREDGAVIARAATQGAGHMPDALAAMRWDIPAADGRAQFGLWQDANDDVAWAFRNAFRPFIEYLEGAVDFNPHFWLIDGRAQGCDVPSLPCGSQCINGGYYCATDPDGDLDAGISGADIVVENLRQMCVFGVASASSSVARGWWMYADAYAATCTTAATWTTACAEGVMRSVGIDAGAVRACVASSNATAAAPGSRDFTNTLLQSDMDLRAEMNIRVLPSATVEDVILSGGMAPIGVLKAICAAFWSVPGSAPAVCRCTDGSVGDLPGCVNRNAPSAAPSKMPGWAVALLVIGILCCVASIAAAYYYARATHADVSSMLEEYSALPGGDEGGASAGAGVGEGAAAPRRLPAFTLPTMFERIKDALLTPPEATPPQSSAFAVNGSVVKSSATEAPVAANTVTAATQHGDGYARVVADEETVSLTLTR